MKFKNVQQIATSCKTVGIVIRKMNKEILKKINNNTNTIEFTLYSINQSTQNILSNDKNSFSEIFNLLDYISVKHPNVRVTLNLPIFKNNIKEIMPTIGWIINFDFALALLTRTKISFFSLLANSIIDSVAQKSTCEGEIGIITKSAI